MQPMRTAQTALTVGDIAAAITQLAPAHTGTPGDEYGLLRGRVEQPVTGVACMWNAHAVSIRAALARGCNLLIVHETPYFAAQQSPWYDSPQQREQLLANQARMELIEAHDLALFRCHSPWDALPRDGVPDQAVAALDLPDLRVVGTQKYFRVHQLPQPLSLGALGARCREKLELPTVNVWGDAGQPIERFAFLIGGFGGNQWNMPEAAKRLGAQAVILGEIIEWTVLAALECGLGVIETLHSASEIPAIRRQAQLLAERFPNLPVHYVDSGLQGFLQPGQWTVLHG